MGGRGRDGGVEPGGGPHGVVRASVKRRDWGRPWATGAPPPRWLDRSKRGSPGRGGLWDGKAGELPHLPTLVYHPSAYGAPPICSEQPGAPLSMHLGSGGARQSDSPLGQEGLQGNGSGLKVLSGADP